MMRSRTIATYLGVISVLGGAAALLFSGGSSAATRAKDSGSPSLRRSPKWSQSQARNLSTRGMTTITEYQLETVGVALAPPTATSPPITASQAIQIAEAKFDQPVLEEVLAQCSQGAVVNQICWAVSLTPPPGVASPIWGGPALAYSSGTSSDSWRFELVLVDAKTGDLITGIVSAVPPTAPTS